MAIGAISEVAIGEIPLDIVAAGFSFLGFSRLQISRSSKKHAAKLEEADEILVRRRHSNEAITLPHKPIAAVFDQRQNSAFLTKRYEVEDGDTSVRCAEILSWLQEIYKADGSPIAFDHDSEENPKAYLNDGAQSVKINASLFELYAKYHSDKYRDLYPRYQKYELASDFSKHAKYFARSLGLTLQKSKLELPANDITQTFAETYPEFLLRKSVLFASDKYTSIAPGIKGFKDARLTVISMDPTIFIGNLLQADPNPTELWQSIHPFALELSNLYTHQADLDQQINNLKNIDQLTGTKSPVHERQKASLESKVRQTTLKQLDSFLGLAATVMVRQRKEQFSTKYESLFSGWSKTDTAEDQSSAILLYDKIISAITNLSTGDIDPQADLEGIEHYMQEAVKLTDGTLETFRRLYEGLRANFPRLNLPETIDTLDLH